MSEQPKKKSSVEALIAIGLMMLAFFIYRNDAGVRAWINHPAQMFDCRITKGNPEALCLVGLVLVDLTGQ